MSKIGTMNLTGKSGKSYAFGVYQRSTNFQALAAIYVMSKRSAQGTHSICYIGPTADLSSRPLNHHRKSCFDSRGANCVSVLLIADKEARCAAELDLIHNYDPACNKQPVPKAA